ncbi:speckle-type POZ protein-like A [Orussus abietinus]|uniref:speckle-type POZ protein-like A n=1 Tax=Orussus abietinus TaxID=222816 RepID=UPI0006252661|nr:speckle-type POZ protein-like A [Orussus abietinus]XP_012279109.1 speckle-type POZ protein-like A [Orussus abietinus]
MDTFRLDSDSVGSVKCEKKLYSHVCTIDDFSLVLHTVGEVTSASFPDEDSSFQWYFQLLYDASKEMLSVYVVPLEESKSVCSVHKHGEDSHSPTKKCDSALPRVFYRMTFSYRSQDGKIAWTRSVDSQAWMCISSFSWNITKVQLLPFTVDSNSDAITVKCEFCLLTNIISDCKERRSDWDDLKVDKSPFMYLWTSGQFSDVVLKVSNKQFPAHKAILATHSIVFRKMFESDMEEAKKDMVDITDVEDPTLVELMLKFLYLGPSKDIMDRALELIYLADKYDIETLKTTCSNALLKGLTVENSVDTVILASRHSLEELKSQAIDFIVENLDIVMKIPKYKELLTYPDILNDIIHKNFNTYLDLRDIACNALAQKVNKKLPYKESVR